MTGFVAQLQAFLDARQRDADGTALLLVECGIVRELDAHWGYDTGEAAHGFFASRLRAEALREQDLLVAAGRDEFACALSGVADVGVAMLAADKVLRALDVPVWAGEDEIHARPAIGIAMAPDGAAAALLGHARAAARRARDLPGRVAVFEAAVDDVPAVERLRRESGVRTAVVNEAMEFRFRPQFDLRTDLIVGADSLLAWEGGMVSVREAVASALAARHVNEAARWVIGGAIRHCPQLAAGCGLDLRVSLSLSVRDLHLRELADSIAGLLKVWNIRPSRLCIAVSDTHLLAERPDAREALQAIAATRVRLGLDEPTVELGALAQYDAIGFDEFRLPAPLLRGIADSERRQRIVRSLVGLAHDMRMEVLADGVADAASASCLKDLGCEIIQGDHVGPALDAQGFIDAHQQ